MGSRPIRGMMLDALAKLCDDLDLLPDGDREDKATAYALHYLSGGTPYDPTRRKHRLPTVSSLAVYLNLQGCDISRPLLQNWLTNEGTAKGRARREAYQTRVKQDAASSLVEGGLEALENAQAHEASLAKAQAQQRNWMAERLDRSSWGQQVNQGPVVYGDLHLHALQRPTPTQTSPSAFVLPAPRSMAEAPPSTGTAMVGGGEVPMTAPAVPITAPDTITPEVGTHPVARGTPPSDSPVTEGLPSKNYTASGD